LRLALSKGPNRIGVSPHLRTETDPVSERSCLFFFLVIIKIRTMDKFRNPSNSVYFAKIVALYVKVYISRVTPYFLIKLN
jgi:hypothetical protein